MPTRSKNARHAALFGLAFFELLRRGHTRRRAGSAKGKGRALGNAPGKAKAEKPPEKSRKAHLRIAFGNARAPCREPRQSLRFGESLRGAGGSAPSHPFWRRGGLTATKQTASEKSPCAAGARGLFSLSRLREAAFSRHAIRLDGGEYSPPEPELSCRFSSPPPGGDAEGGGGASFTPDGVSLGSLAQGRGKEGRERARLCPEWAQLGNGERPATLDKKKIFFFLILFNNFI